MRLQQGISLLEVLIAVLLLKVSVLGALSGQLYARQLVVEATQRTQATAMATDWLNRMQAAGSPDVVFSAQPGTDCFSGTPCAPVDAAIWLQQQWQSQWFNAPLSLASAGYCHTVSGGQLQVTIHWHRRQLLQQTAPTPLCDAAEADFSVSVQASL
ncbi:hypothetical protein Q3O60_11670 [Alkalimonas collagenimarina]|uniref:Type IV pilus modification protein PilV n=1 Tax=Alkalimonas collagenimarina TaxID=400390 RepID=A0ABT9H0K6_9GAMM|nr:hypothetical protein [Alkalimonas collagenimarina]MDP4536851.1 hypothetical protein [Alkalimonas collagenimarina]